ncbi:MAG TPA: hypothetical protein VGJ25_16245 [Gaiellaceae bacterium]
MPRGEQFKHYYPGLIPIEAELWRAWLREHEAEFQAFEYNVHVGQGVTVPARLEVGDDPAVAANVARMFQQATQKKIDVVGHRGEATWIIEVEDRPGTRALGQLLTYRTLLAKQRDIRGPLELVLICHRLGADMLEAFDEAGVVVWKLEQPGVFTATKLL